MIPGKKVIKFAFSLLVAACTIGSVNADRPAFTDEEFGKIVSTETTSDP